MKRVYVFKRFERFWHWSQAALIILMLISGFEIHGTYAIWGFEQAIAVHITAAWVLIGLWVFAIFWHATTGEWRHYIPTTHKLAAMARYYSKGIFLGEPRPFRPTERRKHNPLQRLAYLGFKLAIAPMIWVSGILYLYYNQWAAWGLAAMDLQTVALVHTGAAFLMAIFLVGHVYMAFAGHTLLSHIKAMITGWDEYEEDEAKPAKDKGTHHPVAAE